MGNRIDPWPYATPDLPGVGGRIRERMEDFLVEEVPLYEPCGKGTHLYLYIEKRGISSLEAVGKLAKALNRRPQEFGLAGLKDADAVTRQYLSLEHASLSDLEKVDLKEIRILDTAYHKNKLKKGHLRGNRFRILVRDTGEGALEKAKTVLRRLQERGVPNYFGPQRFGNLQNTHLLGEALVRRDYRAFADVLVGTPRESTNAPYEPVMERYREGDYQGALENIGRRYKYERRLLEGLVRWKGRFAQATAGIDKRMLQFYFSAFQSHYFNRYLERRLESIDRLEPGEIAFIHQSGASFRVEDPEGEADRVARFEISPSGPIYGSRMLRAGGNPGRLEEEILKEIGLELEEIQGAFGIRLRGARRPLRIVLQDCRIEEKEVGLELSFFLSMGSYATVVLREVIKDELK